MNKTPVQVVYDGECPFCKAYTKMLRIQQHFDVELINARDPHPLVTEIADQGLNLDDGMVVKLGGVIYHGADAMNRLAIMSTKFGLIRRLSNWIFSNPTRSRLLYPFLRFGRNMSLKLLGFKKINP